MLRALRPVLLALLMAALVGFAIGTWSRLRFERPVRYLVEMQGVDDAAAVRKLQPMTLQSWRFTQATSATPSRAFARRASTKNRSESRLT